MAKYLVIVLCAFVLFFAAETITGSSVQYVSEKDLMADPTKCRVTKDASEFMKLKDIAHQITFTIFGHGCDQLFIAFYNVDVGAIYYASHTIINHPTDITETEAKIVHFNTKNILNKTIYQENSLNLAEYLEIRFQFEYFGDNLSMKISLPNEVTLRAVDNTKFSIDEVHFNTWKNKWYYNCPSSKVLSSKSATSESATSETSTDQNMSAFTTTF